jgi:ABC-2 type transport system ATP-binding protein
LKGYSLGMRQRLGLASALLGEPELLVLDEPANGLDPEGMRWLRDFLRTFASNGGSVLVSSHVLAEVEQTVDRVVIINRGRFVAEAALDEITARVTSSVRVRSPQAEQLAGLLAADGIAVTPGGDGRLSVSGAPSARVGEIAAAHGVVLHELVPEETSLEAAFLALTQDEGGDAS